MTPTGRDFYIKRNAIIPPVVNIITLQKKKHIHKQNTYWLMDS